jgi:hypothetical protein
MTSYLGDLYVVSQMKGLVLIISTSLCTQRLERLGGAKWVVVAVGDIPADAVPSLHCPGFFQVVLVLGANIFRFCQLFRLLLVRVQKYCLSD